MSINGGMDKEDVVHIYNGILLSHKKEWNNAICSDVDGPRGLSHKVKSVRKKKTNTIWYHMWNLKKWYEWPYLQSRNRLTGLENKLMVTKGEGGEEKIRSLELTYTHYYI